MKAFKRSLALLLAVLMLVPSFMFPVAGAEPDFTVSIAADKTDYSVGDTVTATVYVSPTGKTINSYQFTLSYNSAYLQLLSCVSQIGSDSSTTADNNGTYAFVIDGAGVKIDGEKLAVAKISFKVLSSVVNTVTESIGLDACYIGEQGTVIDPVTEFEGAVNVKLHKHVITLNAGEGGTINGGASMTFYAKHNAPGLYSDAYCTTEVENVVVLAKDGYVLSAPQWSDGTNTYADFDAIKAASFSSSATLTLQTVKKPVLTVSMDGVTGGTLKKTGTLAVAPNADISHNTLVDAGFVPTANNGYTFSGWTVGGQTLGTTGTVKVTGNVTVKPVFTANKYSFTAPAASEDYTVAITGGVDNGQVTHDKDVTMTVTPAANHAVANVSYTVNGAPHVISPVNGVYTIPGGDILGDIAVIVETVEYRTVTFKAGTGITMNETTLYTKYNTGGLFTDPACTKSASVPVPVAQENYRLPADDAKEPMWKDASGTTYTSAAVQNVIITDNLVLTVNAIKQVTVSFVAGENGSLSGDTQKTVDAGSSFASIPKPETIAAAGYKFDKWAPALETVNENTTFTAMFVRDTYKVSIPSTTTYTVSVNPAEGISKNADGSYNVIYGTDVSFTVAGANGAKITGVKYQVNGQTATVLGTAAGTYTIPGNVITAPVTIIVDVDNTSNITFAAGENGSYNGAASSVKNFTNGYVITEADIPVPTANPGYVFSGWDVDPEGKTVSGDMTYTAKYQHGSYEVKINGQNAGTATHGTDFKLPAYSSGSVINSITVKVGGNVVTAALDAQGNYVIAGNDIVGTVEITTQSTAVTITFIAKEQYYAIADGNKIAALQTAKLSDSHYQLQDGVEFFWSDKYNAYVRFVDAGMTQAQLAAQLSVASGAATEIVYDGDISGKGGVNVVDAGIVNDTLTGNIDPAQVTDMMRFKMDVSNDATADNVTQLNGQNVQVTTGDIQTIVNRAVGK